MAEAGRRRGADTTLHTFADGEKGAESAVHGIRILGLGWVEGRIDDGNVRSPGKEVAVFCCERPCRSRGWGALRVDRV